MIRPAAPGEARWLSGLSAWAVAERDPWAGVRRAAFALYVAGFVVASQQRGLPVDRESVILWICGALAISCLGRPWRRSLQIVLDWLPVAAFLLVYDLSRGIADTLGSPVQFRPQLDAERFLFAGTTPTVWLQERFVAPAHVQWWEVPVSLLYVSHFFVPFVLAGVLWARDRPRWVAWMRRFISLSFAGLATYIALPAAPPWLADRAGLIPDVQRTASRGWWELDLGIAGDLIDKGQATANAVAAVPSLHAAFALLAVAFVWRSVAAPWRILLALYPLGMGFALVVSAEHYAVDVLLGWVYVAAVMVACSRWERRRGRREDSQQERRTGAHEHPDPPLVAAASGSARLGAWRPRVRGRGRLALRAPATLRPDRRRRPAGER
jgi:hypothetical protein